MSFEGVLSKGADGHRSQLSRVAIPPGKPPDNTASSPSLRQQLGLHSANALRKPLEESEAQNHAAHGSAGTRAPEHREGTWIADYDEWIRPEDAPAVKDPAESLAAATRATEVSVRHEQSRSREGSKGPRTRVYKGPRLELAADGTGPPKLNGGAQAAEDREGSRKPSHEEPRSDVRTRAIKQGEEPRSSEATHETGSKDEGTHGTVSEGAHRRGLEDSRPSPRAAKIGTLADGAHPNALDTAGSSSPKFSPMHFATPSPSGSDVPNMFNNFNKSSFSGRSRFSDVRLSGFSKSKATSKFLPPTHRYRKLQMVEDDYFEIVADVLESAVVDFSTVSAPQRRRVAMPPMSRKLQAFLAANPDATLMYGIPPPPPLPEWTPVPPLNLKLRVVSELQPVGVFRPFVEKGEEEEVGAEEPVAEAVPVTPEKPRERVIQFREPVEEVQAITPQEPPTAPRSPQKAVKSPRRVTIKVPEATPSPRKQKVQARKVERKLPAIATAQPPAQPSPIKKVTTQMIQFNEAPPARKSHNAGLSAPKPRTLKSKQGKHTSASESDAVADANDADVISTLLEKTASKVPEGPALEQRAHASHEPPTPPVEVVEKRKSHGKQKKGLPKLTVAPPSLTVEEAAANALAEASEQYKDEHAALEIFVLPAVGQNKLEEEMSPILSRQVAVLTSAGRDHLSARGLSRRTSDRTMAGSAATSSPGYTGTDSDGAHTPDPYLWLVRQERSLATAAAGGRVDNSDAAIQQLLGVHPGLSSYDVNKALAALKSSTTASRSVAAGDAPAASSSSPATMRGNVSSWLWFDSLLKHEEIERRRSSPLDPNRMQHRKSSDSSTGARPSSTIRSIFDNLGRHSSMFLSGNTQSHVEAYANALQTELLQLGMRPDEANTMAQALAENSIQYANVQLRTANARDVARAHAVAMSATQTDGTTSQFAAAHVRAVLESNAAEYSLAFAEAISQANAEGSALQLAHSHACALVKAKAAFTSSGVVQAPSGHPLESFDGQTATSSLPPTLIAALGLASLRDAPPVPPLNIKEIQKQKQEDNDPYHLFLKALTERSGAAADDTDTSMTRRMAKTHRDRRHKKRAKANMRATVPLPHSVTTEGTQTYPELTPHQRLAMLRRQYASLFGGTMPLKKYDNYYLKHALSNRAALTIYR